MVRTFRVAIAVVVAVFTTAAWAPGQTRVVQDGRLFDANPQVGGARYNYQYGRPASPLLGGNAIASGSVGRGFSLQSSRAISAPTAFHAHLGSGYLSNFMRDSVGVADSFTPSGGLSPRLYFDPSQTAPSAGFLQGYYSPRPSTYAAPGSAAGSAPNNAALNPWGGVQYGAPPAPATTGSFPINSGIQYNPDTRLNTELSSTIFGVQRPSLPRPTDGWDVPDESSYSPFEPDSSAGAAPLDMRLWVDQELDLRPSHLGVFAQDDATSILGAVDDGAGQGQPLRLGMITPPRTDAREAAPPDMSMTPGHDVFTDMRLAMELTNDPDAAWYSEMLEASANDPTRGPQLGAAAPEAAAEFVARVLSSSLQSFAGRGDAPVNEALRQAEGDMDIGRYRDALLHYERANRLDPANPLPLIGKGHAALAAGEYMTAAASLIAGLDRFPELTRFSLNLESLIGGGEIVDIRRADLMKLLDRNEDSYLRFLLGYVEYHTGMTESGLRNLDAAADNARPGDLIRRYPAMLRGVSQEGKGSE